MSLLVVTVEQMRKIEHDANERGLSYAQMMQNAGTAAANAIINHLQNNSTNKVILFLIGPGNNGGDGLVCAKVLAETTTCIIKLYFLTPRPIYDPQVQAIQSLPIERCEAITDSNFEILQSWLNESDIIVDAILGTGVSRPIHDTLKAILQMVAKRIKRAESTLLVVALDGPTGMNYDTGTVDPNTVAANLTLTFHALKRGHVCFPAAGVCGKCVVLPIGINSPNVANLESSGVSLINSNTIFATPPLLATYLPKRRPDSNKGTNGRLWVIGGCDDYVSAPALSALAAYRVGAGLVTLVVPPTIKPMIVALCREATYSSLNNHKDYEPLKTSRAILVGPGMGQSLSAQSQLASLMAYLTQKHVHCLVLDADALNLISPLDSNHTLPPRTILTPHPGEMSRLTGLSIAEIQADRIGNALKYATLWRCVVVLKGAYTVVASPDGEAVVMPFVNPAMAVAGTGDILAGAISGFAAQNVTPFTAAICGAFVHGTAGEMWRTEYGDAGLLASDLLPLLPKAIKQILAAKQNNLGV